MDADPAGNSILFNLLLLLFFTLLNAFFAGAEMAVVSVNKNRIRSMADEGNKKAKVIEGLFEDSTKFLSTIQVAITFAGFYSSASAASGISPVLAQSLEAAGVPYSSQIAYNGVTLVLMFFPGAGLHRGTFHAPACGQAHFHPHRVAPERLFPHCAGAARPRRLRLGRKGTAGGRVHPARCLQSLQKAAADQIAVIARIDEISAFRIVIFCFSGYNSLIKMNSGSMNHRSPPEKECVL